MLFYLDKKLAKQGIAKCIAVSEKEINIKELEERKRYFNVSEILIFEGIDIPHKFKYNEELDTIEEIIEIKEIQPRVLSESVQEKESDFDERVEIDPEKQYFYLDKEYADRFHKSQIIAVFQQPLKYPNKYFQKEVYSHFGKDIPYYISIDEGNIVREATEYEKYLRKQRKLEENEVILKEEIIILYDGQYIEEKNQGIITIACPSEYISAKWDKEKHIWIDLTTDLERVNKQYREYVTLNNPLRVEEMKEQGLFNEWKILMKEMEKIIENQSQLVTYKEEKRETLIIPKPSLQLEEFKNKINNFNKFL